MPQYSDYNFSQFGPDTYLLTNMAGRYVFLNKREFDAFVLKNPVADTVEALTENYFYSEENKEAYISDYSSAIRQYKNYLFSGTGLHIFVLTSKCNFHCLYCQASTKNDGEMMTMEVAKKSVDLALQSPSKFLSFEFQGGEPLENFDVLKYIVQYVSEHKGERVIEFNLVSNLTLLTDEMIKFIKEYHICVSTSLDGNEVLQNTNRPLPSGNSYQAWKQKYEQLRSAIDWNIGAIQTTTRFSLSEYQYIVDEYIRNGFETVFIRPLTPLGYALSHWDQIGYSAKEFVKFYKNAFRYIISIAKRGKKIREGHAVILLRKILGHTAGNYTELRSPCGAALGQLAYNYNGRIYTCDEGRMMAEMGDASFEVGTVESRYEDLFSGKVCKAMAVSSCLESIPQCAECVYSPYCGVCPVLNYESSGSLFSNSPNNYKCQIYHGMLDVIFECLLEKDKDTIAILREWAQIE